ncbi:MAG: ATP-binding protein [Kofleriaceae bacterium]
MDAPATPDTTLATVALERARAFAPFVLAGIAISLITSGPMGIVPLPLAVYVWNGFAITVMSGLVVALYRHRVPLRYAHFALELVWIAPLTGTLITQVITGDPILTYVLTVELLACGLLLRARWLLVMFVIVDVVWIVNAIVTHTQLPLYGGLIGMSQIIGYLFHRVYTAQIVRAETHRREQEITAQALAAQLDELRRSEEARARLHEQLVHAQRMEAVGTLSAGLAHDMNNILGSIMSFAELARDSPDRAREELDLIISQAARGAELTRALLAFSRRGQYRKQALVLGDVIRDVGSMLTRTLPKSIELRVEQPDAPIYIAGDPTQLVQVLVNLAVNAADAMSGTGTLSIVATSTGETAHIEVSDTGMGMDEETLKRVFEPFFTTKERGKGTGLGLSTVWGIVTGHDGSLDVRSTVGAGTTFRIRLPLTSERPAPAPVPVAPVDKPTAARLKILVVDDEPDVRRGTRRILERKGYETLEAANGAEALEVFAAHADEIGLVVLDMMMPVMGGREFFEQLRMRSDVPVLVTTGHTSDAAAQHLIAQGVGFLEKPFPSADLVREATRLLRLD